MVSQITASKCCPLVLTQARSLIFHLVDSDLFEVSPDLHQSLFQLRYIKYWLLVHALLHADKNLSLVLEFLHAGFHWSQG